MSFTETEMTVEYYAYNYDVIAVLFGYSLMYFTVPQLCTSVYSVYM